MDSLSHIPDEKNDEHNEVSVKQAVEPKTKSSNKGLFITIIVLLVISIGLGCFYLYNEFFKSEIATNDSYVLDENKDETEEDGEDCVEVIDEKSTDYVMKNEGWGLYSMPEYGFSVEIPDYTHSETVDGKNLKWNWGISLRSEFNSLLYSDSLYSVNFDYIPDSLDSFGCGGGCADEHALSINIYANEGSKTLDEVAEIYFANLKKYNEEAFNGESDPEQEKVEKWGLEVIKFVRTDVPSDIGNIFGYFVVTDDFVYTIEYYFSPTPSESFQVAEKLLDSFVFDM